MTTPISFRAFLRVAAGVIAAAALAFVALACGDEGGPADPPASFAGTSTPEAREYATLPPVAQTEIVATTETLANDLQALNASQAELLSLVQSGADVTSIDAAQRETIARGISLGITADLLADAASRQDGEVARDTAAMYQDIAKQAYAGAYALSLSDPEDIASKVNGTAEDLALLWSFLNAGDPDLEAALSPGLGEAYQENMYEVAAPASDEQSPSVVVTVSGDRQTMRLARLDEFISAEAADADSLLAVADPASPGTLDDLRAAAAARAALYAEPEPLASTGAAPTDDYVLDLPKQILVSLGATTPDAGTVYRVIADSGVPSHVWTFLKDKLLPSKAEQDEIIKQVIAQSVIDSFLDPGGGPDLGAIASLIGGDPPPQARPPQTLSFEEFLLDDVLPLLPVFRVQSVDVVRNDPPRVWITVAYEDVSLPTNVWCALHGRFRFVKIEPGTGSGTVRFEWDDAFDLGGLRPDDRRRPSVSYGCASPFGLFGDGAIAYEPEGATTPERGPDTPPGTTMDDPVGTLQGTSLVVEVTYANPSGEALPLTCHFNGPAFSGSGGFNKETQTIAATTGTATFVFDLGGPPQAGTYDITCVLNDDISRSASVGLAAATPTPEQAWGIYSLEAITEQTNSALGLIVAEASEVDSIAMCSLDGGGLDCNVTVGDFGGAQLLLGPFATREEAEQAFCASIVPDSVYGYWYPIATFTFDGQEHPINNGPAC